MRGSRCITEISNTLAIVGEVNRITLIREQNFVFEKAGVNNLNDSSVQIDQRSAEKNFL